MRRGDDDFYYHVDDLGSVVAITDGANRLVERYDYQDFGEPSIFDSQGRPLQTSAVRNPYLFTGQRYDPETGLYYYRARYLDPLVGRFTTRDPSESGRTPEIWGTAIPTRVTTHKHSWTQRVSPLIVGMRVAVHGPGLDK